MNAAKALLDSLMGPSRDKATKDKSGEDFKESNVCKHFLVGFCPQTALGKRQEFLEPCPKLHSLGLREELQQHAEAEKYRKEYEEEFLKRLEDICAEADARAMRERRKRRDKEVTVRLPDHLKRKIAEYEQERKELIQEAEEKGAKGDVKGSEEAMNFAAKAEREIQAIRNSHTIEFPGEGVCDACGVRYLLDRMGEYREEDHYESEVHSGYIKLREKLKELREKVKKNRESRNGDRRDADRPRSRKADRDRRKEEKERDKENGRGRSRSRDRDRERDREGGRDRDRERDRDRRGGRARSRSGSRSRRR